MPNVTPVGSLSTPIDALRTLIANIPFFQTWTGTVNAAAALARIFTGDIGFPIESILVVSAVMTITTRFPHTVKAGDVISIEGASIGAQSTIPFAGSGTVISVGAQTLTIATALGDLETYYPEGCLVLPAIRPMVCILEGEDSVSSDVIATGGITISRGTLEILLDADVSSINKNDNLNALYEMRNAYGQLHQGIGDLQGTGDYICLNRIETVSSPMFIEASEQSDGTQRYERWRALIRVSWGLSG